MLRPGALPREAPAGSGRWKWILAAAAALLALEDRPLHIAARRPEASAAGQFETFLGVGTTDGLVEAVESCMRSLHSERAARYRAQRMDAGADDAAEAMSVVVILCLFFSLIESKLILPAHLGISPVERYPCF